MSLREALRARVAQLAVGPSLVVFAAIGLDDHTALTHAVESGLHDVAAMLLAAGASVNHRTHGGVTALAWAVRKDDFATARLLLEYRADPRLFVEVVGRPV